MGVNYHSSISTATLWKPSDINPRFSDLDEALTLERSAVIGCNGGGLAWDSTAGILSWSSEMKIVFADPDNGKMVLNIIAAGAATVPVNNIVYAPLSTVSGSTVSVTYVAFSTASTALIPANNMIFGVVDTNVDFHPHKLFPSLSAMLNTAIGSSLIQHNVTSTAYHIGPSTFTEDNVIVFSSVGLPKDGGYAIADWTSQIAAITTHARQHNIDATADHVGTITEGNVIVGSSVGLFRDSSVALSAITTHAQQHALDSTADHTGTITDNNIVLGSTEGLIKDSGRAISGLLGGREATMTCSAAVTVDFSTAETQVMVLTTNCTVTLSTVGITDGQVYRLRIQQDGTGAWALTWDAGVAIHWRNSTVGPTITTSAGYSDWLTFVRSQSTWYADAAQNFAG